MTLFKSPPSPNICSELSMTAFLRLKTVLTLIPVSKSTWWGGVRSGRYPKPVKLGPRITAWRAADIAALIINQAA